MEKTTRRLPIVERDEWLQPVEAQMNLRHERYERKMADIGRSAGSLVDYANGYRYFGWQWDDVLDGWWLREPGAHDVYVFGDFNNWQRTEIRMHKDAAGVWSAFFPAAMYRDRLRHGSLYKIHVHGDNGWLDRIPAYATRVVQDEATKNYTAQFWAPEPFDWRGDAFDASKIGSLLIYEAHVGMAQEREGVGTYREFTEKILPIIKKDGYNAVQLGYEDIPERKLTKPEMGHLNKAGVAPKKYLREFDLENAAELNAGDIIKADTFKKGDFVDVTGTTKGHGYQGVIKRWGAQRTPMSHGGGPVHRHAGSMGSTTDPSRIFKGKIGAGQMGCDQVTIQNLDIVKVDPELNMIAVRGAIPGPKGGLVLIKSTVKTHRIKHADAGISNNPQKASGRNPQKASARTK